MLRFVAGVVSTLLMVAAGFFIWQSQAQQDQPIPPAPQPTAFVAPLKPPPSAPAKPPAQERTKEQQRFARYDANEDGTITRAEMLDTRRKAFAGLDTNGDGRLAFEEWAIATSEKFAKADANRSGGLNAAEFLTTKRETKPKKCSC
jgi:hypothetical protein